MILIFVLCWVSCSTHDFHVRHKSIPDQQNSDSHQLSVSHSPGL